jgi:hypothetical protein
MRKINFKNGIFCQNILIFFWEKSPNLEENFTKEKSLQIWQNLGPFRLKKNSFVEFVALFYLSPREEVLPKREMATTNLKNPCCFYLQ